LAERVRGPQCGSESVYFEKNFEKSRNGWESKSRHVKRKFALRTGTSYLCMQSSCEMPFLKRLPLR
jgi:hypothetical protein